MIRILANDGMDREALRYLEDLGNDVSTEHLQGKALKEKVKSIDVLVVRSSTKVDKELIDAAVEGKVLKLIVRAGVGMDNIDLDYATQMGIVVKNTPRSSSVSVAELTIAHLLVLARNLHKSNVTMHQGEWHKEEYTGIEISGKTLGIIGFGRIGQEVAKRAFDLGMKVVYNDHHGKRFGFDNYKHAELEELFREADFISLHVPYNEKEGPVITKYDIEKMKDGVFLINVARGGVICEGALLLHLDTGKVAGAALDVFEEEPLSNPKLYSHPSLSLSPHLGGSTKEAQKRIGCETANTILDFFNLRDDD